MKNKTIRNAFIKRCHDSIERLKKAEKYLSIGHVTHEYIKSQDVTVSTATANMNISTTPDGIQDLRVLVHAYTVQEWLIFLDDIYQNHILNSLCGGTFNQIPTRKLKMTISPKDLSTTSIVDMRKCISGWLKDSFSFDPYTEKINIASKLFNLNKDAPQFAVIKKHVIIRNLFQHNRGVVRESDLTEIGQSSIQLKNDACEDINFIAGNKISLSLFDITQLMECLEIISSRFI